jgi:predicted porin
MVAYSKNSGSDRCIGATTLKAGAGRQDLDNAKTNFIGLGADDALSKCTTRYVSAGRTDPKDGDASHACGAGISHSF